MARHKTKHKESLNYHEGLSFNQVKIILTELGFPNRINEFSDWMFGQTCPVIRRSDRKGVYIESCGVYEYDLFRWISSQKTGIAPIWD